MPRKSRIDAAYALHHVIIRGLESRGIIVNDKDREIGYRPPSPRGIAAPERVTRNPVSMSIAPRTRRNAKDRDR
jgi:hypothetical protein